MIKLKNLTKVYTTVEQSVPGVTGISMHIKRGEFIAITGHSGCGKTTLLNIVGLIDVFDDGEYLLNGVNVSGMKESRLAAIRQREFGYVFQSYHLIHSLTAIENVALPLGYMGMCKKERVHKAEVALARVDLSSKRKALPSQLSGGQQQRVAIARALIHNPAIVLADEPTGNLDSENSIQIMHILESIHKMGATVIIATHDIMLAEQAGTVIQMRDSKIISSRTTANSSA